MFFDERTKRSLSISDVSEKTLINIKYLNAIESGDYSDFPSEGFARAYFIKYANFLSLKCDFPEIYATKNRKEEIVKKSVPMINNNFYKAIPLVGVLILIFVVFILLSIITSRPVTKVMINYRLLIFAQHPRYILKESTPCYMRNSVYG